MTIYRALKVVITEPPSPEDALLQANVIDVSSGRLNPAGAITIAILLLMYGALLAIAHRVDVVVEREPRMPGWKVHEEKSTCRSAVAALLTGSTLSWWLTRLPGEPSTAKQRVTVMYNTLLVELTFVALFIGQDNSLAAQVLIVALLSIALGVPLERFLFHVYTVANRRTPLSELKNELIHSIYRDMKEVKKPPVMRFHIEQTDSRPARLSAMSVPPAIDEHKPAPEPQPSGPLGWLGGLFGGAKAGESAPSAPPPLQAQGRSMSAIGKSGSTVSIVSVKSAGSASKDSASGRSKPKPQRPTPLALGTAHHVDELSIREVPIDTATGKVVHDGSSDVTSDTSSDTLDSSHTASLGRSGSSGSGGVRGPLNLGSGAAAHDRAKSKGPKEGDVLYVCPPRVGAMSLVPKAAQRLKASLESTLALDDAVLMPAKALISVLTPRGEMVGFFVKLPVPDATQSAAAAAVARAQPEAKSRWFKRSQASAPPPDAFENPLEPQRPAHCPNLTFVQARVVLSAATIRGDEASSTYFRLSPEAAAHHAQKEVRMVHVLPVNGGFTTRGQRYKAADLFCECDVARNKLLRAYADAEDKNKKVSASEAATPPSPGGAHKSAHVEPSDVALADADDFAPMPHGSAAIERYCRISKNDLTESNLWFSRPKAWRLRLAWAFQLSILLGLSVVLLLFTLTPGYLNDAKVWVDQVVKTTAQGQAMKIVIMEPAVALGVPILMAILRCLPDDWAADIVERIIDPYTKFVNELRNYLPF